jgi:hypothetical protein
MRARRASRFGGTRETMALTERQRGDLHTAMLEYLLGRASVRPRLVRMVCGLPGGRGA